MKLSKILNQQLHVRFTSYCLVIKFFMLYSAKYKKRVSNLRRRKVPLFTVLSFCTPKLVENLKLFSINSQKSAQCMFYIRFMYVRQTTEEDSNTPFSVYGQENKVIQERSCDMPDVVDKKETLSPLFCTKY